MSKTTILIVEDEAIVAADLSGKLRRLGYEVCGTAMEGEEAVALALSLRPHLVLMDIRLEGSMDGIAAAEAIRSRLDAPVIYLTALSDAATLARAKLTGPFGYILKPFDERDLATQVELALYKHQADRQIREQSEWLRVTLTSIGDAVITCDTEGRVTFLNPVAESLTGWKAGEATGNPLSSVFRIINEQTGQPLEDPVARVLNEGRAVPLANHAALVAEDGRTVPIEDSAAPILDAAGQVIGVVLVFHDVTEKRRAEEERETTVTFLGLVNRSSGTLDLVGAAAAFFQERSGCEAVGIRLKKGEDYPYFETRGFPREFVEMENSLCSRDAAGNILRDSAGNPYIECMCGNVICGRGDPSKPFFSPGGSFWTNDTTRLLATTNDADRQTRTLNRCNGEGYESVALVPLQSGSQRIGLLQLNDRRKGMFSPEIIALWERLGGYLAVALAKLAAQESMRESEEFNRRMIESSPDCIKVLDLEGNLLSMCSGGKELLEIEDLSRYLNRPWIDFWLESDRPMAAQALQTARAGGKGSFQPYCPSAGGKPMWWEVIVTPMLDQHARPERLLCISRDITERKNAEDALREKEKLIALDLDAMTRLHKIGMLFASEGNLEPVLGEIVEAAIAISCADFGSIQLLDPESCDLVIAAQRGFPEWWVDFWKRASNGHGTCGAAFARGERVIVEDVEHSPIFIGTPALEIQLKAGVRAVQSTPLINRSGKLLGMLSTHYKTPHRPDDRALRLLDLLARHAADIIEHAQAEEHLIKENREMGLINRILRVFTQADGDDLFEQVLESVQEGLASSHGVFGYVSEPGHLMCPSLSKMLDECEIEGKCIHYPPEKWKGLWARSLLDKRSFYANKPSAVPPGHPPIRNNLAAPILFGGEAIGLLNLANKESDYTENDRALLETMAERISPLLYAWIQKKLREDERTQAEQVLRKSHDELELRVRERTAELKAYMAKLETSNQALQDFASIASHDMQEPLRKVISFGNMLKQKHQDALGETGNDYLKRMLGATERMQILLTTLLEYSRAATKQEPFREVDLYDIVHEVLSDLEVRIAGTGGEVQVGELPVIEADSTQMRQLFQNLIGNALKFHRDGEKPMVKITSQPSDDGHSHEIVVEDNGIGFDVRHTERIFAPFHRLHGRSSEFEGTGMGLAICKKIVERHGGVITAKSTAGEGATFIVTLPMKPR